jgi:predicted ATPase/DNA-binding SARP family transcriptional activator/pimeloyl-ACP methyl ester carboxylesterase/tRNA A-37 threonylcarbamoyl transferase component Bud32
LLQIILLGQFDVRLDGKAVELSSQPAQSLLAYLLLNTGVAVRRDQLAGLLWPDSLDSSARKNLRNSIWLVRKAIGDTYLVADKSTVAFAPTAPFELDVAVLQEPPAEGDLAALVRAVSVYRGELLPGFYDDWIQLERERLRDVFERRIQALLDLLTAAGQWGEVQRWAEHWISLGHVPEPAYRALMLSHAARGDLSRLASAYRRCQKSLQEELDVEPSNETQSLYQRLLHGEVPVPSAGLQTPAAPVSQSPVSPQTPGAPQASISAGETRQRFVTQELLAVGGQGEVFLGYDQWAKQRVVIKRLKPDLMTHNAEFVTRFVREGETLRQLNHPNVVQMLAAYEKNGEYCIVMEYVPGGTLRDLLDRSPQLPLAQVLAITLELADALSRAHHLAIIHRDIKPDNVLLAADGTPRLTDFGVARLVREDARLTQPGTIVGSPAYMSPEALRGETLDVRSDIWSFGVLMFEMLAGFHPFNDTQISVVLAKILSRPMPDLQASCPEAPAALAALVRQMLVKDRAQRMGSMRQVAATLEAIRDGLTRAGAGLLYPAGGEREHLPADEVTTVWPPEPAAIAHLVGREAEVEALQRWFAQARAGTRQIVFIAGEAGLGKTALVEAFLAQVERTTGAWLGQGQCLPYRGAGEAYMPVLDALGRLCRAPGGGDLVALLDGIAPTWLVQMPWLIGQAGDDSRRRLAEVEALQRRTLGATRERMLREMAEFVESATVEKPLILVLEDLHWCDPSTLDLITWLARRQEAARLLLIGTYRPADVKAFEHPLAEVVQDLRIHRQCAERHLSFLTETAVETYLQQRFTGLALPPGLATLLHQRTGGNPLFMHNVVDSWLAQEAVVPSDGKLLLQVELNRLAVGVPESLRAMIEQQLSQLQPEEAEILAAAAVAGMEFSAALVAAATSLAARSVEAVCSVLARRGAFLQPGDIVSWADGTVSAAFSFSHQLYQAVLYDRVTAGEKLRLHRQIGERLETAYGRKAMEHAAELADHFARGHDAQRAVTYLQAAAEHALQRSAHQEAIGHLNLALELLATLPETPERAGVELSLQSALAPALLATRGWGAAEVEQAYRRARDLCRQLGDTRQLSWVLYGLAVLHEFRGEYRQSQALMEQRLKLPLQPEDTGAPLQSHTLLACSRFHQGSFAQAAEHAQEGLSLYNPEQHAALDAYYGEEPGIACHYWSAHALWFLGYPDQAVARVRQALDLAEAVGYQFGLVHAREQAAYVYQFRREAEKVLEWSEATIALASEQGFPYRQATGMILHGWALAQAGRLEEGLAQLEEGLAAYQATGAKIDTPYYLALLAEIQARAGQAETGLKLLSQALDAVRESQAFFYEAEIHRLQGEMLRQAGGSGAAAAAEAAFRRALDLARRQQARSLELRASVSLCRLWHEQGNTAAARETLGALYGWFSEGFDTPDLQEAAALLELLDRHLVDQPQRAEPAQRHNLPAQPTAFVGRQQEVAGIRQLVEREPACRLLTLIGPGGSGKTRLALQAASLIAAQPESPFTDGVWFVPLAPLSDPQAIVTAIAGALGLALHDDRELPQRQLLEALQARRVLLLLDNFEHLLNLESIALVGEILAAAPHVKLLTTSRARLNLSGEQVLTVGGLEVPSQESRLSPAETAGYSAIQLFLQHARRARPAFELADDNVAAVIRICRLAQGMPLAIELAAAWLKLLSPDEIAAEIAQSLDILESEWHSVPERQRSLRAVFNSSWQLLSQAERAALQGLAIFQGGFTRAAAEAISGITLKGILALADKSWLQRGDDGRFQIHELLRQYAAEKLHADPEAWRQAQERHSAYYVAFLQEQRALMWGPRQADAFDAVGLEFENIRFTWDWLVEQQQLATVVDQMLPPLFRYCELMVRSLDLLTLLAVARLELEANPQLDEDGRLLTIVLIAQAAFSRYGYPLRFETFGNLLMARQETLLQAWSRAAVPELFDALGYWGALLAYLYGRVVNREEGMARLGQVVAQRRQENARWEVAFALALLGLLRLRVFRTAAERAETEAYLAEALAIFEELGDERESAYTLRHLGQLRRFQRAYADAIHYWHTAQARLTAVGDWSIATEINWQIGDAYLQMGDFEAAFRHYGRMTAAYISRGYRGEAIHSLSKESYEALRYSDVEHARQTRQRCLLLARESGNQIAEAWSTWEMGEIYRITGEYDAARRWFEDARILFDQFDEPAGYTFYHRGLGDLARSSGNYQESEIQFRKSLACARSVNHEWGASYALTGVARAAILLQQYDDARSHLAEALRIVGALDEPGSLLAVLSAAAALQAALGNDEYAAELSVLVANHYATWREIRKETETLLAAIAETLPPDRLTAVANKGRQRDIWQAAEELMNELSPGPRPVPHNLPAGLSLLVGREKEVVDIGNLLAEADGRLLTLVGPGGIGKTRLAVAAATAALPQFPQGAYFVALAPLQSAGHIVAALAESLDLRFLEAGEPKEQLLNYLQSKKVLLILDNFEHLLAGVDLVAAILQSAPQVKILVTSREHLNLSQETIYVVGGLDYPDWATPVERPVTADLATYTAVQLLLQRARQTRSDFEPQPHELHDAGRICRLVQGMPLAIELAAGWVGLLSLHEIGNEIARNLDFLETERQDVPARQRNVRAVFETSWNRLTAGDRQAFMKLSIFRDGFTRQAAQSVAGAGLKTLRMLVGKSFVSVSRENRYQIHELLRQYGEECLEAAGAADQARDAHMAHFLGWVAQCEADIRGGDQPGALSEIEADFENVRAAWNRAIRQSRFVILDQALETLHFFMDMRGRQQEGADLFQAAYSQLTAVAAADSPAEMVRMRLLLRYRFMKMVSSRQPGDDVAADLDECLAVARRHGNEAEVALCLSALGSYLMLGNADPASALEVLEQAYDRFVALQDGYYTALALQWLGICHYQLGNREQFLAYTRDSVEQARQHGNHVVQAYSQINLAENALLQGEYHSVESHLQDTILIAGKMRLHVLLTHSQLLLATLHLFNGNIATADLLSAEAFDLAAKLNYSITLALAYAVRALMDSVTGKYGSAERFGDNSVAIRANHGLGLMAANLALAMAYCGQQKPEPAWQRAQTVLKQIRQEGFLAPQTWLLPVTAVLLGRSQAKERAVELLALAQTHPLSATGWLAHWPLLVEVQAGLERELGADAYQAAWDRGKGLDLVAAVAELLPLEVTAETPEPRPVPHAAPEIRFCHSAGKVRIAYATVGQGPPLLKAANWLSHLEYDWQSPVWQHWLAALSSQHRLIRYDRRGCGLSDWDVDDFSLAAHVADMESVVEALGLERFPLLGLSGGSPVAIAYAARHPEKVSHLILYGSYLRGRLKRHGSPEQLEEGQMLLKMMALGWGKANPAFRQVYTSLFIPEGTAEQIQWFNELQRISTSPEVAVRMFSAGSLTDVSELARQVTVPTLVLHARDDAVVPFAEGREVAATIPGARFVSLESQNHILLECEPVWQRFVAEFHRFVATPVPAASGSTAAGK